MCKWHWQSHRKTSLLERDSYSAPTSTLFKELFKYSVRFPRAFPPNPDWSATDTPLCCFSKESFCSRCNYRGFSSTVLLLFFLLGGARSHHSSATERSLEASAAVTGLMTTSRTSGRTGATPVVHSLPDTFCKHGPWSAPGWCEETARRRASNLPGRYATHPAVLTGFSSARVSSSVWQSDLINIRLN